MNRTKSETKRKRPKKSDDEQKTKPTKKHAMEKLENKQNGQNLAFVSDFATSFASFQGF